MEKTEREVKYPKSLRRAHERLTELERAMDETARSESFERAAEKYKRYAFRQRNLSLRPIRTLAELLDWSKKFNNCSYGYAERIAGGRSMIFVLVNREERKSPYYMIEYDPKNRVVVQCRDKNNRGTPESDETVKRFISQWLEYIKARERLRHAGGAAA